MRMMNAAYGKPVILLIDEYDVPLSKAYSNGYYREMRDMIHGMMSMSLKANPYLKFAVITGCLRIPKESIFTGVNNFASYSVMDDRFSQYFGFTAEEVDRLLGTFNLADKADVIRQWCDEALRQISSREYAENIDGYRQVLRYGIAFYQKTALVKSGNTCQLLTTLKGWSLRLAPAVLT